MGFDAGPDFDGGPDVDGGVPHDGAGLDGFVMIPDSGPRCMGSDRCTCPRLGVECGAGGACPTGTACTSNTCGEQRCLAVGGSCATNADCPATSTCTDTMVGPACVRGSSGCADSRECTPGFACEGGACVDRRTPCVNNVDCPWGYLCHGGFEDQGSYCEYIARACDDVGVCPGLLTCRDVDGDGEGECTGMGTCACTAPNVCGTSPTLGTSACRTQGPCTGTCASGFECIDTWGDGQRECVPTSGSCTTNIDCPSPQVCASPNGGGPPECIEGNLGLAM